MIIQLNSYHNTHTQLCISYLFHITSYSSHLNCINLNTHFLDIRISHLQHSTSCYWFSQMYQKNQFLTLSKSTIINHFSLVWVEDITKILRWNTYRHLRYCIQESFKTKISSQSFHYKITFEISQHENTISKSDFILKTRFKDFWYTKISLSQKYLSNSRFKKKNYLPLHCFVFRLRYSYKIY